MDEAVIKGSRILIVDDQEANVKLLERFLGQEGYTSLTSTTDPRQVLPLFMSGQPDLILLDLQMPHLDGFAVMRQLSARVAPDAYLPILVLTADTTPESKQRALSEGAKDFLTKPFDRTEVLLRIRNLLTTRHLHANLQNQNLALEARVKERTAELEASYIDTMTRLALAAEFRDDDTGEHTQRVGQTSALIAQTLGLSEYEVELIRRASPLHDVGKIGIPDGILLKRGKLTDLEFEQMKSHTTMGARILSGSRSRALQLAEEIALYHHEKWDGTGYVMLAGESIPLVGRIVAVADVFDALTHERPYKPAWPVGDAIAEIKRLNGSHFDPQIVEAFLQIQQPERLLVIG